MAIIGKIRKRSGLLVVLVAVALALFVLSDFLGNKGGRGAGGASEAIGEIYGSDVTYAEFQNEVNQTLQQYFQNREPSEQDKEQIREWVWSQRVNKTIYEKEFGDFGLTVSARELEDLIFGNNIQPDIMNNEMFKDSMTGQFNVEYLKRFRQQVDQNPDYRKYWVNTIEKPAQENRSVTKYFNMVAKGLYVTTAEANQDYLNNTRKMKIRFVQSRYSDIPDSTINVSEDELNAYFSKNKHKKKYENMGSRSFSYVAFKFVPSEKDIEDARNSAVMLKDGFSHSTNDSDYVMRYAETKNFSDNFNETDYPEEIDSLIQKADSGAIFGPFRDGDYFKVVKVRKSKMEERFDSRHVLIAYKGGLRADPSVTRTKEQAKKLADSLATVLRKTKNFDEIVPLFSADKGSIEKGGKYEDIKKGMFAAPYEEFCLSAKKGEIKVVETDFGYHVIEALGVKEKKVIAAATVDVKIVAGRETSKEYQEKAYNFYTQLKDATKFQELAQAKKLKVEVMELNLTQKSVDGTNGGRNLARWVQSANEGDVSEPTLMNDSWVIATVTNIKEKGVPELDDVRDLIKSEVLKQKKGEILAKKMQGAKSLEEVATRVNGNVQSAEVTFGSAVIPGTNGTEYRVIGSIFSLKSPGDLSVPLAGQNACYVVLLENIVEAPPAPDIKTNKSNMTNSLRSRAQNDAYQALREVAKVVDNRYKFF